MKDAERPENYSLESEFRPPLRRARPRDGRKFNGASSVSLSDQNINSSSNGNGLSSTSTEKDSLSPSPQNRLSDDVKAEPMELVCNSHNLPSDEQSNDSAGDNEAKFMGVGDGKGSLRYVSALRQVDDGLNAHSIVLALPPNSSNNDDDIENSIHSHMAPQFLTSAADNKMFPPGGFNFPMSLDPATLASKRTPPANHFPLSTSYSNVASSLVRRLQHATISS